MIKLTLKKVLQTKIPINISTKEKSIIFYINHKDDDRHFFINFIKLDFSEKILTYYDSYLPENVKIIDEIDSEKKVFNLTDCPHSTIEMQKDKFMCFVEKPSFFYVVDMEKPELLIYTSQDLSTDEIWKVLEVSPTNYEDYNDLWYFYFSVLSEKNWKLYTNILKASKDLKDIKLLNQQSNENKNHVSHVIRYFNDVLLMSDFDSVNVDCNGKNMSEKEWLISLLNRIFIHFEKNRKKAFLEKDKAHIILMTLKLFYSGNRIKSSDNDVFSDYLTYLKKYLEQKGFDWQSMLWNLIEYGLSPEIWTKWVKWNIITYNITTDKIDNYETKFSAPAHFEIDEETNSIFVSSHNFVKYDRRYFTGPGAIDKFILEKGKLKNVGTFVDETWFRYTSHKLFRYKGKLYVCITWYPNRLFFVDAQTMKLEYYFDSGDDILSKLENVRKYLNSRYFDYNQLWIEILNDEWLILIIWEKNLLFYSFPQKKILDSIPYIFDKKIGDYNLKDYIVRTVHIQELK